MKKVLTPGGIRSPDWSEITRTDRAFLFFMSPLVYGVIFCFFSDVKPHRGKCGQRGKEKIPNYRSLTTQVPMRFRR